VIAAWIFVTTRSFVNLSGRLRMHASVLKIKNGPTINVTGPSYILRRMTW
jgi:hypothetical protein